MLRDALAVDLAPEADLESVLYLLVPGFFNDDFSALILLSDFSGEVCSRTGGAGGGGGGLGVSTGAAD